MKIIEASRHKQLNRKIMCFGRFLIIFGIFFISCDTLMACTLSMGYRSSAKVPFINEAPDNSGFYQELYSVAAKKIGCSLKIIRKPKKRIYRNLEQGTIDFYPRLSFTKDRENFIYFIDIGFVSYSVGLSRNDLEEVTDLKQLKGKQIIRSLGATNPLKPEWEISTAEIPKLDIKKAIEHLRMQYSDFFIYDFLTLKYFLKANNIKDVKLHLFCCKGNILRYMGFSKNSKFYNVIPNPNYDKSITLSVTNHPDVVDPTSKAAELKEVLRKMHESGETQSILIKYVGQFTHPSLKLHNLND